MKAKDIQQRIDQNITRVENLVEIYRDKDTGGSGRRSAKETDALRAAVVLLHASLEDCLRSLARLKHQSSNEVKILDKYPFPSHDSARAPLKISMGYLAQHRGKGVNELINQSIQKHLDMSSYSSIEDIVSLLRSIDVEATPLESHFSSISAMIERRHQIVHRADRVEAQGSGNHQIQTIKASDVTKWIESVKSFHTALFEAV